MISVIRSSELGQTKLDWLDSKHTFSFGDYYNPKHTGFYNLRVLNHDIVEPGAGFPSHTHHDMEIITFVIKGTVKHKDNMGNKTLIKPGEIQLISAGTGIIHSEVNASKKEPLEFLQIWVKPNQKDLRPSYQQTPFSQFKLALLAGPKKEKTNLIIHQDLKIYYVHLQKNEKINYPLLPDRAAWITQISGHIQLDKDELAPGDNAEIDKKTALQFQAKEDSQTLLFDTTTVANVNKENNATAKNEEMSS